MPLKHYFPCQYKRCYWRQINCVCTFWRNVVMLFKILFQVPIIIFSSYNGHRFHLRMPHRRVKGCIAGYIGSWCPSNVSHATYHTCYCYRTSHMLLYEFYEPPCVCFMFTSSTGQRLYMIIIPYTTAVIVIMNKIDVLQIDIISYVPCHK